jgi:hypothetical protein
LADQARAGVQVVVDKAVAQWRDGPARAKVMRLAADLDRATAEANAIQERITAARRERASAFDNDLAPDAILAIDRRIDGAVAEWRDGYARASILREQLQRARDEDAADLVGRIARALAKLGAEAEGQYWQRRAALAEALAELFAPLNVAEFTAALCRRADAEAIAAEFLPPGPAPSTLPAGPAVEYASPLPESQSAAGGGYWTPRG